MNPWYVLISDSFNAVVTKSIIQKCWTLKCLSDRQLCMRILIFDKVAAAQRTGRP